MVDSMIAENSLDLRAEARVDQNPQEIRGFLQNSEDPSSRIPILLSDISTTGLSLWSSSDVQHSLNSTYKVILGGEYAGKAIDCSLIWSKQQTTGSSFQCGFAIKAAELPNNVIQGNFS